MKKKLFSLVMLGCSFLSADLVQVTKNNVDAVLNDSKLVVLDVYTDWCPPCKMFSKVIHAANEDFGDKYLFAKLNAEDEAELAMRFQVRGVPTIIFFKDGKEVARKVGFLNREKLLSQIEALN
jgi:thioredoxin 1